MADDTSVESFYDRLGIIPTASAQEIRRAYRALVRQYSPEKHPEEFKRIREAYETLSDPKSRKEYDTRPAPEVEAQITAGVRAMEMKNFERAEQQFKQVLLQSPDLGYVRNLLGLCFMYEEEADNALAQFQKLMASPDPAPAWFGNGGHALLKLKRYDEAVKAFREAIKRAGDNPGDYVIGLADTLIEQEKYGAAATTLDEAIALDGKVDFNDLRYFTKLLEVYVRDRQLPKVTEVANRITAIEMEEDQKDHTAWRIGGLAAQLVAVGAYSFAAPLAKAANRLQPAEPDFQALSAVAAFMAKKEFRRAAKLLETNKAFQRGGRLAGIRPELQKFIDENEVFLEMKPITSAPSMFTLNTVGTRLYGNRDFHPPSGSHVSTLYFVIFFLPICPLACYRVIDQGDNRWSFLGKVPFSKKEKRHLGAFAFAVFVLFLYSQRPSTAPTTPVRTAGVTQSGAGAPSGSSELKAWIDKERSRLSAMEDEIKGMDADLKNTEAELNNLAQQIKAAEQRRATRSTDPMYAAMVDRYNTLVPSHNVNIDRRRSRYADYQQALTAFNQQVDIYNAGRGR